MQLFGIEKPFLSAEDNDAGRPGRSDVGVLTRTRAVSQKPSMYRVLLLNDDFTPMDFVIHVLERFFGKNRQEATEIMLQVHRKGVGICGTYTYEVAETKVLVLLMLVVVEVDDGHEHGRETKGLNELGDRHGATRGTDAHRRLAPRPLERRDNPSGLRKKR